MILHTCIKYPPYNTIQFNNLFKSLQHREARKNLTLQGNLGRAEMLQSPPTGRIQKPMH